MVEKNVRDFGLIVDIGQLHENHQQVVELDGAVFHDVLGLVLEVVLVLYWSGLLPFDDVSPN